MIDKDTAQRAAYEYINGMTKYTGLGEIVILDDQTIDKEYGWIFFYAARKYLETNDYKYVLYGGGPIVVEKQDSTLHPLGSAHPAEKAIDLYEKRRNSGTKTR